MNVDFLIVAALKDEAKEIAGFLKEVRQEGQYLVGKVQRWKGRGEYSVAIVNLHDGMGALESGPATQGGIANLHPRAVILTGIAAGFEDSRAVVRLGDLMIPCGIVNYDLGKIKADGVEHRGIAWAVSESLWQTAATTAGDPDQPWLSMMTEEPPEGFNPPIIHAFADSVLGCGEKVIAAAEAEVRKWLLATYPRQILGLEMESSAAQRACRVFDTPFLVVKASVDRATAEKDDRWRPYTCQLSAAFIVTVLQRYEQPQIELLMRHRRECTDAEQAIIGKLPHNDFGYKVLTATSFEQLRQGIYEGGEKDIDALIPNDLHRIVALFNGGGAGKSTVVDRMFGKLLAKGYLPVLIDLKKYSQEYGSSGADDIDTILNVATTPRRTTQEIEQLAGQGKLALLIDGVNEVSKTALASVLAFCQELRRGPGCYVVWANRMAQIENLGPAPYHATLGGVPEEVAARLFNEQFGQNAFRDLGDRLRAIYRRPFFLDLAMRSGRTFKTNRLWSGIFAEFFSEHLAILEAPLNRLSRATRDAIGADGKLKTNELKAAIGDELWNKLEAAEVGVVDQAGFEHHLWRDYLVARALSLDPDRWTEDDFDAASTFGTSVECLAMVVEQLEDAVAFVNAVYDWNYGAALDCIAMSGEGGEDEPRIPKVLQEALVAAVAEKRFDHVERTRVRTERLLARYPFARPFLQAKSREEMVERVGHLEVEGELATWQRLYCQPAGGQVSSEEIELVGSSNSLIGWTAANLIRRGQISSAGEARLRDIYMSQLGRAGRRSVRWRVVHALGVHPSDENLDFLARVLATDEYRWVLYGSARSLVEAAAAVQNPRRRRALDALLEFVNGEGGEKFRPVILEEIVETCFIDGAARGWHNAARPVLERILDRVSQDLRHTLGIRVAAFQATAGDKRQTGSDATVRDLESSGAVAPAAPPATK